MDFFQRKLYQLLKFATSAKSIKNKPIVNEVMDEQVCCFFSPSLSFFFISSPLFCFFRLPSGPIEDKLKSCKRKLAQQNESGDRLNLEEYQKLQEDREEMERRLEEEEQHRKSQEETIRKLQEKIFDSKDTTTCECVTPWWCWFLEGEGKPNQKKSRRLTVCVGDIRGQQTLTFGEDDIDDDLQEGEGEEDHDWEWGKFCYFFCSFFFFFFSFHVLLFPSKSGGPGDQLEREKERGGQKGLSEMKGFGFSPIRFNEGPSSSSLASFSLLNSPLSSSNSSSSSSENYMDSFFGD